MDQDEGDRKSAGYYQNAIKLSIKLRGDHFSWLLTCSTTLIIIFP